jgi:hypothetical protein
MEVDDNSAMMVGNPQGILCQQLMTHEIHLLNINIKLLITH